MKETKAVIIVAGGKGERMKADMPKQFLSLGGLPVLMRTMNVFFRYDEKMQFILVLPGKQIVFWKDLCEQYQFSIPHTIVGGGETRFHSVLNGLNTIEHAELIAVHDGVRPLVSLHTIAACFETAKKLATAVPVISPTESLREIKNDDSLAVNRANFRLVQTPQIFEADILKRAYKQPYIESFTDDASVVESTGIKINLVEGNRENIKITNPVDLKIAELLLFNKEENLQ